LDKLWRIILAILSRVSLFSLSGLKSWVYRRAGACIGDHVYFGPHSRISLPNYRNLKIGDGSSFGSFVNIYCEELKVGEDVLFSEGVFAGGTSSFKIGDGCFFARNVYIDLSEPVVIEDDVGIGADYIFTHSIWHPVTEGGPRKFAGVRIKRGAWIPAGVFIMPGVTVGEGATVGARAVVVEDVPDGVLVVGVPAKIVKRAEDARRRLTSDEKDEIVKEILNAYTTRVVKTNQATLSGTLQGNLFSKAYLIERSEKSLFWARKKLAALVYSNATLGEKQIKRLAELCAEFEVVLFVSLVAMPDELMKTFNESRFSNLFWFSVEGKIRKRSWRSEVVSLHTFFRSNYGIRFRFYPRKSV
jgi:acetyltransferase-like isoleucine patch superfamily enzyme